MKQQTSAATETKIKGRNIIDFTGKTICVGIDTHEKDYHVAKVINGICLGNHRMKADHQELIEHLRSHYPGATFKCVYESCAWVLRCSVGCSRRALNVLWSMQQMYLLQIKKSEEKPIR
jgi:hypothetical protein